MRTEPGPARSAEREEFEPKYISVPQRRSSSQGRWNLGLGVGLLFLSAVLFGWGLYLAGPGAVYTVGVSLATATALYVIARSRLLRQRNGSFLAAAIVCLLAVFCVLVQQAWVAATRGGAVASNHAPAATPEATEPALADIYRPAKAELESGPVAKVVKELKVELEGKTYRLRPGDLFPVGGQGTKEVRLAVGLQEVIVPPSAVQVTDMTPSAPVRSAAPLAEAKAPAADSKHDSIEPTEAEMREVNKRSQAEAMKKYPALGERGSPENRSFLEAFEELRLSGQTSFFEDPEWPMKLADQLASREKWGDKDRAEAKKPSVLDQPAEEPLSEPPAAMTEKQRRELLRPGEDAVEAPAPPAQ